MCTPPFCEPVTHCFGCVSLKTGATAILVLDAFYGLVLVIVHALLLGEVGELEMLVVATTTAGSQGAGYSGDSSSSPALRGGASSSSASFLTNWYLQMLDLDIALAHNLLGFSDYWCLLAGLTYGILVLLICAYTLHAVIHGGPATHAATRWFVAFAHFQLAAYCALALVKVGKVCSDQAKFLPMLAMSCQVLRYQYLEQCAVRLVLGSLCCWVFASYAYLLSHGGIPEAPKDPTRAYSLVQGGGQMSVRNVAPQMAQMAAPGPSFQRSMQAPSSSMSTGSYQPRGMMPENGFPSSMRYAPTSVAPMGAPPQGGAYHSGSYAHRPSFSASMPRATSSMVTTTGDPSEMQSLILKGPIAAH